MYIDVGITLPFDTLSNASCTNCSDCVSNALVASSSISICGFFNRALAIATLRGEGEKKERYSEILVSVDPLIGP